MVCRVSFSGTANVKQGSQDLTQESKWWLGNYINSRNKHSLAKIKLTPKEKPNGESSSLGFVNSGLVIIWSWRNKLVGLGLGLGQLLFCSYSLYYAPTHINHWLKFLGIFAGGHLCASGRSRTEILIKDNLGHWKFNTIKYGGMPSKSWQTIQRHIVVANGTIGWPFHGFCSFYSSN